MRRKSEYISLTEATEVSRRHAKDVRPPQVMTAKNVYSSPADHALTLRPDTAKVTETFNRAVTDGGSYYTGTFNHPTHGATRVLGSNMNPLHAEQFGQYMIMNCPDLDGTAHGPYINITKISNSSGGTWYHTGDRSTVISLYNALLGIYNQPVVHVVYSSGASKYVALYQGDHLIGNSVATWNGSGEGLTGSRAATDGAGTAVVFVSGEKIYSTADLGVNSFSPRICISCQRFADVCWDGDNAQFCAVGTSGIIYTSAGGISWTRQTSGSRVLLYRVIYSTLISKYVAVGHSGTILTSPDGVTWTAQASGISQPIYAVAEGGSGVLVALAFSTTGGTEVLTSTDGATWTSQGTFGSTYWNQIIFDGVQFIAGRDVDMYTSSDDGETWDALDLSTLLGTRNKLVSLSFANSTIFIQASNYSYYLPGVSVNALVYGPDTSSLVLRYPAVSAGSTSAFAQMFRDGTTLLYGSENGFLASATTTGTATKRPCPFMADILDVGKAMDGEWIIVGKYGALATTNAQDLEDWGLRDSGVTADLVAVHAGPDGKVVAVGTDTIIHADDVDLSTWADGTGDTTGAWVDVTYGRGYWVAVTSDGYVSYSADGEAWTDAGEIYDGTAKFITATDDYVVIGGTVGLYYASDPSGIWTEGNSKSLDAWCIDDAGRLIVRGADSSICRCDFSDDSLPIIFNSSTKHYSTSRRPSRFEYYDGYFFIEEYKTTSNYSSGWIGTAIQVSEIVLASSFVNNNYKSAAFASVDGQLVLFNVTEGGTVYGRRARWTAPGTYDVFDPDDMDFPGAGYDDYIGEGEFVDARRLGHNILIWETAAVSLFSQTGQLEAPWEYRRLRDGISIASNPVVLNDRAYFIAKDGMLYVSNAVSVTEAQYQFDLSKYEDFTGLGVVWLAYEQNMNALCVYRPTSTPVMHVLSLDTGFVSHWTLPCLKDGDKTIVYPTGIGTLPSGAGDSTLYLFYDGPAMTRYAFGGNIVGSDYVRDPVGEEPSDLTRRWWAVIEVGELPMQGEGGKLRLTRVLPRTYSANGEAFDILVQARDAAASSWDMQGDKTGTAEILTNGAVDGSGTVWSYKIADGDDWLTTANCPYWAGAGRFYIGSTLLVEDTDYTVTDEGDGQYFSHAIELASPLAIGEELFQYWENEPTPTAAVNDFFMDASENFYRISAINRFNNCDVEWYAEAEGDAYHNYAEQVANGESEVRLRCSGVYNAPQIRLVAVPRTGGAKVAKVLGFTVEYVPAGGRSD